MSLCDKCGKLVDNSEKFCPGCGEMVTESSTEHVGEAPSISPSRARIDKIKDFLKVQNLVRLVGAIIILVSTFLPYYITGGSSLGLMVINFIGRLNLDQTYPMTLFIMINGFFLLLIGGITAIVSGRVGGLLALVALILLSVPLHNFFEGFGWLNLIGLGYFGPLIGIIVIFLSGMIGRLLARKK